MTKPSVFFSIVFAGRSGSYGGLGGSEVQEGQEVQVVGGTVLWCAVMVSNVPVIFDS